MKMGVGDVGIDLGRCDVAVPKHGLDTSEVGSIHEEVSREAMAERVRADVLGDAGRPSM